MIEQDRQAFWRRIAGGYGRYARLALERGGYGDEWNFDDWLAIACHFACRLLPEAEPPA